MHHIKFAQGTLGCSTAAILLTGPAVFLMISFMDFTDSHVRGVAVFAFLQTLKMGDIPIGAAALGLYLLYLGVIGGWRWSDGIALVVTDDKLYFHPSYFRKPIAMGNLTSIIATRKTRGWTKSLKPKLIIRYLSTGALRESIVEVLNVDLSSPDAIAAVELLKVHGKWAELAS